MNLRQDVEDILYSGDDYYLITRGIESLYEKYSESTQIFAGNLTHEHMKETANGRIVTPVHAAHCVKDLMRTTRFMRGVYHAIEQYLNNKDRVRILYAGCGPYGTLLTPFTALYSPEEIGFTFLEIEETSVRAVNKLYEDWGLKSYLDELKLADATDPDITFSAPFDIIISETMQAGLRTECQVPITRNLVRFLSKGGTFIPQQISLDVYLTGSFDPLRPGAMDKEFLGTAYNLDFRDVPVPGCTSMIAMKKSKLKIMQLFTEISLFGEEKLTARQSGLTIPITLDHFKGKPPNTIHFTYREGEQPGLTMEYQSG
ncbi:MAG: hypothetical protein AAFW89_11580 [Bacteroidota bacterium]